MHEKVIGVLEEYDAQFIQLIDLCDKSALTSVEKKEAKRLLLKLKHDLARECQHLGERDRLGNLSQPEKDFLLHFLPQIKAEIQTKVASTPGRKWIDDLMAAQSHVTHTLGHVRKAE